MADDDDLNGTSLLLVDDAPANLDVLCALLEAEGFDVALAADGLLALEIAANTRPDLIMLDVMMPQMDGFEVCRRLKRDPLLKSIPVIFIYRARPNRRRSRRVRRRRRRLHHQTLSRRGSPRPRSHPAAVEPDAAPA